jgi:hypothetical protein
MERHLINAVLSQEENITLFDQIPKKGGQASWIQSFCFIDLVFWDINSNIIYTSSSIASVIRSSCSNTQLFKLENHLKITIMSIIYHKWHMYMNNKHYNGGKLLGEKNWHLRQWRKAGSLTKGPEMINRLNVNIFCRATENWRKAETCCYCL